MGKFHIRIFVIVTGVCMVGWFLVVTRLKDTVLTAKQTVYPNCLKQWCHSSNSQNSNLISNAVNITYVNDANAKMSSQLKTSDRGHILQKNTAQTNNNILEPLNNRKYLPTIPTVDKFKPSLSPYQKDLLMKIVAQFTKVCQERNITYFMYGGTLLGSYRHHDLIPWDDDIDVIVPINQRAVLHSALSLEYPEFRVRKAGPRLKFYANESVQLSKYPWKWPYVDIHFYLENDTHIWDSSQEFKNYVYGKDIVFPLHMRPLGPLMVNSPFDAYANLRATYRNTKCQTHFYSHRTESLVKGRAAISCGKLKDTVPFVHRTPDSNGVRETLYLGNRILQIMVVEEPTYAVSKPYSLELIST